MTKNHADEHFQQTIIVPITVAIIEIVSSILRFRFSRALYLSLSFITFLMIVARACLSLLC